MSQSLKKKKTIFLEIFETLQPVAQLREGSLPFQTGGSGCMLSFSNAWTSVTPTCAWWQRHFVFNYVAAKMT